MLFIYYRPKIKWNIFFKLWNIVLNRSTFPHWTDSFNALIITFYFFSAECSSIRATKTILSFFLKKIHHSYYTNETTSLHLILHCVKKVRIRRYSGPHFPSFWLNTERYGISLRIQSECGKMRTRITLNTDTFHVTNWLKNYCNTHFEQNLKK